MSSARSRLSIVSLTAIALGGMWPLISKATGELPQGTVRGKIVGADSAGLRNATVIVLGKTSGGQTLYGQASQTIKADDDGKFEFAIDQSVDSVDVLVSAPGFARNDLHLR